MSKTQNIFFVEPNFYRSYRLLPIIHAVNTPIDGKTEKPCRYADIMPFKTFGKENAEIYLENHCLFTIILNYFDFMFDKQDIQSCSFIIRFKTRSHLDFFKMIENTFFQTFSNCVISSLTYRHDINKKLIQASIGMRNSPIVTYRYAVNAFR